MTVSLVSAVDLVIKIKLNHAAELLKANNSNRISDVAYASGFNNPKYFSTVNHMIERISLEDWKKYFIYKVFL